MSSPELTWGAWARLLLVTAVWLVATKVISDYGVYALPEFVRRALTLDLYSLLMLTLSTSLGLAGMALLVPAPRQALGLHAAPRPRGLALGALVAPATFVAALALGIYVALPTLLEEFNRGGAAVSQQNLGERGRVVKQSPLPLTVLWVVVVAPVGEELLFRGALWGALQRLTRLLMPQRAPRTEAEEALEGVIQPGPLERAVRGVGRWVVDGGIATALSTAIFGAMHLGIPGGAGIILVVSSLLLGFVLGTARQLSGGLAVPIALHATYNFLGIGHARNWFVSETFPKDYGVPRLLTVAGAACLVVALIVALVTRQRRAPAEAA